jgi:hypothetical protein
MRPKTLNPEEFTTALKNPGPGAYKAYETMTPKGKLFLSKFHSSGATTINPPHSKRFNFTYGLKFIIQIIKILAQDTIVPKDSKWMPKENILFPL